jgi:SAM-dependent methyltransferase
MTELYRESGLEIYEKSHYSHGEHITEVEQILTWYKRRNARVLDIGCSGGLHAIEFSKRGFSVTGIDIEPSAIELARKRAAGSKNIRFFVADIEKNMLQCPEKFDLIYSIGNVLSHINKDHIFEVLLKISACLDKKGTLLFDVLINAEPFREEIYPNENELQIIWKRKIDEKTGRISMDGIFLESGFIQHFDVWGYTGEEITGMLNSLGFANIEFSEKLDFIAKNKTKNPISLYVRADRI